MDSRFVTVDPLQRAAAELTGHTRRTMPHYHEPRDCRGWCEYAKGNAIMCECPPEPTPMARLTAENVENLRANCHATYNGGHREKQMIEAFHHGMDTVCNVLKAMCERAKI